MIAEKTPVCLVSDPTKTGVVMSVSGSGAMAQYQVFIDGAFRMFLVHALSTSPRSKFYRIY